MAKDQTKPLSPGNLQADAAVVAAIQGMTDYKPAKADYAMEKLTAADTAVTSTTTAFTQAEVAYEAARDAMVAAQWTRHNLALGAKQQVLAQYGDDSDQAQAVGLKKKSERARPARRTKTTTAK